MIVGVQAIPACFDVEQNRFICPIEALEVHLQSYATLLSHPVHTDSGGHPAEDLGCLRPGLAERWDTSRDGRTWNLRLRRGVSSVAGHELTAHDVKWSWERAFALGSWSARIARHGRVTTPDAVRVLQPYVVQFNLDESSPRFSALLAQPFPPIYDLEDVRRHCPVGDPWGNSWLRSHTAGFGPYALDEVVPATEAAMVANLHHWQGAPRERTALLRAVQPAPARAQALSRGSVDVAADLPAGGIAELRANTSVKVSRVPSIRQVVLRLDPNFPPFDQPSVRHALEQALPYNALEREFGTQSPSRSQHDQRGAGPLLKNAGYGSGFRMTLFVPAGNPELQLVAQAIQLAVMRLSLKVVVEPVDPVVFAREKAGRHLPVYLEERLRLTPELSLEELEALPEVQTIVLAELPAFFAARANVEGFIRHPDGRPRYAELRKT